MGRLDRTIRRLSRPRPAPAPDLRAITDRLDALEALVEGLQDSVDRTARRQDNEQNQALVKALPALERIITQATDALRRPGNPPSPGTAGS